MKYGPATGSSTFIVEMTIALLIFAFASAISLGLFAGAQRASSQAADITFATMAVQNLAESARSLPTSAAWDASFDPSLWPKHYGADWQPAGSASGDGYVVYAETASSDTGAGRLVSSTLTAAHPDRPDAPIFELTVSRYYAE